MKWPSSHKLGVLVVASVLILLSATAARAVDSPPPNPSMQWQLGSVVSPWNLTTGRWTELPVTLASGSNIQKIVLTQSTLIDTDSPMGKELHANDICLSTEPKRALGDPCLQKFSVMGGTVSTKQTIWLSVAESFDSTGSFSGSLVFDTEPHTDTKAISVKVQQTALQWQLLGIGTIVAGVFLAWLVTVFGRSRIARDQALMPALVLLDKLRDLQNVADQLPASLQQHTNSSMAALSALIGSLSMDALDKQGFLPPTIPAFGPSVVKTAEYQAFLNQISQKAEDLDILLLEGITLLAARWNAALPAPELADMLAAIGAIDQLAIALPVDPVALRARVAPILQTWNVAHAIHAMAAGVAPNAISPPQPGQRSFIAVRLEVQTITVLFWLIWGLLSVVIGASVLIIPVPGFGSPADFIRCLLWGFGLPVAGSSIQNLTTGTLNTQLGVSITRN